jgi:hypothetical protein
VVGRLGPDVNREEGDGIGGTGHRGSGFTWLKPSSPGVEGRDGEAEAFAESADGEAAALPLVDQLSPVLFLAGIAGLASGHG